jgi:pyruvate formate lyase activating enzyme
MTGNKEMARSEHRRPLIFDIHRFALDDGPGIRTTVFLKGCPLACTWCHNPEGIRQAPELFYQPSRCIACGDCQAVCASNAIDLKGPERIRRLQCNACGRCAAECPSGALVLKGQYYPPDELLQLLLRDQLFFQTSGGGVTFSGGEPTWASDYLNCVMKLLKDHQIHVALQTCGEFVWERFKSDLLPYIDLIYFDLKCIDPEKHRRFTGMDNRLILSNFNRLVNNGGPPVICTVPLISEFTADEDNITAIANYLSRYMNLPYELHPYHPGAHVKSASLGRQASSALPMQAMTLDEVVRIRALFESVI